MNADLIIRNGMVLRLDEPFTQHDCSDVVIQGNKIIEIAPQAAHQAPRTIDARASW